MKAALAWAGIVWVVACMVGFVACLVVEQYGIAFGLAFAALVPVILELPDAIRNCVRQADAARESASAAYRLVRDEAGIGIAPPVAS